MITNNSFNYVEYIVKYTVLKSILELTLTIIWFGYLFDLNNFVIAEALKMNLD